MKSYHLNKSFVIGVIVIFIGVGFQPVFAIKPNILENYEECSECRELNKVESALLKIQLIRLEKYTKLLLGLSRNNPDVSEKCEYLLDYINSFKAWRFPVLCNIILPILSSLSIQQSAFPPPILILPTTIYPPSLVC